MIIVTRFVGFIGSNKKSPIINSYNIHPAAQISTLLVTSPKSTTSVLCNI